jgi:hypothetical protein
MFFSTFTAQPAVILQTLAWVHSFHQLTAMFKADDTTAAGCLPAGTSANATVTVSNTGNVAFHNVEALLPNFDALVCNKVLLAVGDILTCKSTTTITQDMLESLADPYFTASVTSTNLTAPVYSNAVRFFMANTAGLDLDIVAAECQSPEQPREWRA